ncbi:DUF6414 family protein [Rhodococcoides yunnanense]|uniref:DUF6414 family protein n=1 Tax=Rhodococcoides yunnanense TaxID=278209 RepID=UPI0009341C24|nr:hypothetical protein [Rhodococcus yunnanensis]
MAENESRKQEPVGIRLMHPVYLDTPMLLSFLATLENGVSFTTEISQSQGSGQANEFGGEGEVGLPSLVSMLGLNLGASGKYGRTSSHENSAEQRFVREHTAASLFNRLYAALDYHQALKRVDLVSDLAGLKAGDLVEISGVVEESPIEIILDTVDRIWPFVEQFTDVGDTAPPLNRAALRSMPKAQQEAAKAQAEAARKQTDEMRGGREIMKLLREDLQESPVVDLLFVSEESTAVMTASREFFSEAAKATLIGGTFNLIGKVTGVNLEYDAKTDIVRRGAVAGMGPMVDSIQEMATAMSEFVQVERPDSIVHGPCMQIIPLSIFI